MSNRVWMLTMLAGIFAALHFVAQIRADTPRGGPQARTETQRLSDLIAQLASLDFQEREQATKELIAAGGPAVEYVQKAVVNPDAEVRRRAALILAKIEKDLDTARLLRPKRIRLVYRDTPIPEVVADFAKKSGYPLQFEGDRVRLGTRKITLDTGEVTCWEALDQFCRTAGLVERRVPNSVSPDVPALNQNERQRAEILMLEGYRGAMPPARVNLGRIVLLEGRDRLPISQTGGVRLRILHPNTQIPGHAKSSDEAVLALEVSPEPSIDWRGVLEVHVTKAIDLQNREMKQILETRAVTNDFRDEMACRVMAVGGNNVWVANGGDVDIVMNSPEPPAREFPIRLKLNDLDSRKLREIRGVLFARIQTPHEPLIRADKILQAEGKTFQGPENSQLKIHEARRSDKGKIDIRVTVRPPAMGQDPTGILQGAVFVRRFNGRMAFMAQPEGESPTAQKNLALQDARGRSFQLISSEESTQVNGMEITQEFRLKYQSKPGMDEPAQLVYSGQRLVTVEIPFAFKDVPLAE
jgi:hypothetical protein